MSSPCPPLMRNSHHRLPALVLIALALNWPLAAQPSLRVTSGAPPQPLLPGQTLTFGDTTSLGVPITEALTLHNDGDAPLTLELPLENTTWPFAFGPLSQTVVGPGTAATLPITFKAQQPGVTAWPHAILSNDPTTPTHAFTVAAEVSGSPRIEIVWFENGEERPLPHGGEFAFPASKVAVARNFTIRNVGDGDLNVEFPWWLPQPTWFLDASCEGFEVTRHLTETTLGAGLTAWFQITMLADSELPEPCEVSVFSNDVEASPYTFDLVETCVGPGDHLTNLSHAVRGARPACVEATHAYEPDFPTTYAGTFSFNTPVVAAATALILDPERGGPGSSAGADTDVLDWWLAYLQGELGIRGGSWHYGAKETFSGIYQFYNVNAVAAVHYHARRRMAEDPAELRWGAIAELAKHWLRATIALFSTAATPRPDGIYNDGIDTGLVFSSSDPVDAYVALAGQRYNLDKWNRQLRSMIYIRATRLPRAYRGEPSNQRDLLDFVEMHFADPDFSVYGLSTADEEALRDIATEHLLPPSFVGFLIAPCSVACNDEDPDNRTLSIRTHVPYEIVAWADGTRATVMGAMTSSEKAPTYGKVVFGNSDASRYRQLHLLYPYEADHANPRHAGSASIDLAAGTATADNGYPQPDFEVDTIDSLPPHGDLRFHLRLDSDGFRDLRASSGSGGCPAPASTALLGHWDFESPDDLGLDSSTSGRHATVHGTPHRTTGRNGSEAALALDGASYLSIANLGEDLNGLQAVTVSAWVKVALHSQLNIFRSQMPVALRSDRFQIANTTEGSGWYSVRAAIDPPLHRWVHLAATFDQGLMRFYVDGQLSAHIDTPISHTQGTTFPNWAIGARVPGATGPDQFFIGELDDVKVYRRALSPAEIALDATPCP